LSNQYLLVVKLSNPYLTSGQIE